MRTTICMVPSNTLSSTDASKFALKIIEAPIVQDYLSDTHGVPIILIPQVPNEEDWWDTVSKADYAKIISQRHKGKPKYEDLMADKYLKWPDISTFNGPFVFRWGIAPIQFPRRGLGRSEIYEIKPNNAGGLADALKKLSDVEDSYKRYKISGIYKRGVVYPKGFTRTIYFKTSYLKLFTYLVNLVLKPLGVRIEDISIQVVRPESGCLLYKICVDLDGVETRSKEERWRLANFAVRILWACQKEYQKSELRVAAMALFDSLEPDDPTIDPKKIEWIVAGRDLRKIPYLQFKVIGTLADEIKPLLEGIRHTMYSRLMGTVGEHYAICADKIWYQANVTTLGRQKVSAQIKMLSMGSGAFSLQPNNFIMLTVPVLMRADAVLAANPWIGKEYRWLMNHIEAVLIIVGCTIALTAAALTIIASGGIAAPFEVPLTGAALESAGAALGIETSVTGTALGTTGGMSASVMVANAPASIAAVSAGSTVAVEGGIAATVGTTAAGGGTAAAGVTDLVAWARLAAQTGVSSGEVSVVTAENTAQQLLIKLLQEQAVKSALKGAASLAGTAAVVALSPTSAYAYNGDASSPLSMSAIGEHQNVEVGKLYVLPLPKAVQSSVPLPPELYKEFNPNDYRIQLPGQSNEKQMLYMLGCIEIV